MVKRIFFFHFVRWPIPWLMLVLSCCLSCSDDDSFTTDTSARLTFSTDTVRLDTVFTGIGSSTYSFWVYNYASDGIRLPRVYLRHGNQNGFRVNVDGSYLDNTTGSSVSDLEVRKGDSIRVFVELTAPQNMKDVAQRVSDDLIFCLESGVEQTMHLQSYAWDAIVLRNAVFDSDTTISSVKPLLIYGGIKVSKGATLTLRKSQLFFHDQAGIDVYGTLETDSVVMRGDRLDHMFDYLPYDRVSGQWRGIHLYETSSSNVLKATEIRSAMYGVRCDSSLLANDYQRLYMERCVIHNCKGNGLELYHAYVGLLDCQLSNMLGDCLKAYGGAIIMQGCTVAQFYPYSADRGVAIRFYNSHNGFEYPLEQLQCVNSIFTGYADDEMMGLQSEGDAAFNYCFENCLIRTPEINDTTHFKQIIFERPSDVIQGKNHFVRIDETNFIYDFHLVKQSPAQGLGCYR